MRSSFHFYTLPAFALIGCLGCSQSSKPEVRQRTSQLRDNLSDSGIAILKGATRVEVFRVAPEEVQQPTKNAIEGYPILATGKEQGQAFAARLTSILLGKGVTQNEKKCGLEPGVAYRLWKDNQSVEVLVCFKCNVLWPHIVGEKWKEHLWWEWQDFDSVRADLLSLTKEAFPDDQEIQQLSDKGEPAHEDTSAAKQPVQVSAAKQPSWFAIGPEVYHEGEVTEAEKRVLSVRLEPRWFVGGDKAVSKAKYDAYFAGSSAPVQKQTNGLFFIPNPPYPKQLDDLPLEDHGVSLGLDASPCDDPSVVLLKLELKSKDMPVRRQVEHRWTNTLPFLFAFYVDGQAVVVESTSFEKEGGVDWMDPLVEKGGARKWSVKIKAESLRALLPDTRPHTLAVAAAFANRQHEGFFEDSERLTGGGDSAEPPMVVRSGIAQLKWDGTKWDGVAR
jgi:hypothetical protein